MLIGGVPTQPFSMAGLPPIDGMNKELADALKQLSAAKYGRPRAIVEKEIFERISTSEPDAPVNKPTAGRMGGGAPPMAPGQPRAQASFLDEWVKKKETNSFRAPSSPFNRGPAPGAQPPNQPTQPHQNQGHARSTMPTQPYVPAPAQGQGVYPQPGQYPPNSQSSQQPNPMQMQPSNAQAQGYPNPMMGQGQAGYVPPQQPGTASQQFAYDRDANPAFAPHQQK